MIGKTALSFICAGFTLWIATRSQNQTVQASASILGSCILSYTATAFVLDHQRQQKKRVADAEAYLELLRHMNEQRSAKPSPQSVCRGCCHYHGQSYGGTLLVCGMHPFGVEDDHCPDWQSQSLSQN